MRVAFVGKGGVGKSSLAGTFARVLARSGARVVALDSDPLPGLAFSLGLERDDSGIPDDAVQEYTGEDGRRHFRLRDGLTGTNVVEQYARVSRDGVRFLQLGKVRGPHWENTRAHFAYQNVLDDLPGDGWSIVGDLPGGTRQPFMTWGRFAETFLVVVEPTAASILTARRLARLANMSQGPRVALVVNRVREGDDIDAVAQRTGLPVVGSVPFDPALATADRLGLAILDHEPDGPTARAVESLLDALRTDVRSR